VETFSFQQYIAEPVIRFSVPDATTSRSIGVNCNIFQSVFPHGLSRVRKTRGEAVRNEDRDSVVDQLHQVGTQKHRWGQAPPVCAGEI